MITESKTNAEDKDLWATPPRHFNGIQRYLHTLYKGFKDFTLDGCAMPHNKKVERFISPEQDTLVTDWGCGEFVWVNPPYSDPLTFINRAIEMSQKNFVAMLLPSDTSTAWFQRCVEVADNIIFLTGKGARIKFIHNDGVERKKNNNPKGSIVVVFQNILPKTPHKTYYVPLKEIENEE